MLNTVLNVLALVLYFTAGALLSRRLFKTDSEPNNGAKIGILGLVAGAVVLHAAILYSSLWINGGLNLGFNSAASLLANVIVILFLLVSLTKPIENLGILILPVAGLTVLLAWLWPGEHVLLPRISSLLLTHLTIAFLAYSLLTLAVVQALLLAWQEYRLRHRHPGRLIRAMPPIQTMEILLFQMIAVGFVLLTLTLITGTLFSEELFGTPLVFSHHIVLSLIAWAIFGVLLIGHWRSGWRGQSAVRWTLGGFGLLVLAYFGSKFVLEVLLGR